MRSALRGILLLGGVAAACLALGEGIVKLYLFGLHASPREMLAPSMNPELVYELVPDTRHTFTYLNPQQRDWRYTVSINQEGFRGAPRDAERPASQIVVLGDSYAFGLGVDDDETFVARLDRLLGEKARVLNWGVPGYNLVQETALLRSRLTDPAPDQVVIAFHPNDLEPPVFEDAAQVRRMRLSHLYALILHLRFLMMEDALEEQLARDRPERVRRAREALDGLLALSREHGFGLMLFRTSCWSGYDDAEVERFLEAYRARGVPFVDLDAVDCAVLDERLIPDDGHPTAEGHRLLAERLHAGLAPLLEGLKGPP